MEKMEINKAGIFKNKLNIDVTVKALAGESTPTGGDVEFKIKQMGVKDDIAEEAYTKPLENGKAQLQLAKRTLIFRRSSRYLLGALYTICIMLFSAGSSPVVNSMGTDSSVFFTIGRSMLSGKVPYRDLFDHKGWYVYFFNYLGACLSSKTTIGLFIIECAL